jgi:hypothetical protein
MSEILDLYLNSSKPHVVEARQIPQLATDFFDITHKYQDGFVPFEKDGSTEFTDAAFAQYDEERKHMLIPDGFVPTEQGIDLSRWTPADPYYKTGQKKG